MAEPAKQTHPKLTRPVGQPQAAPKQDFAPHSVEAEESVLGSILINPDDLVHVAGVLNPDDFFIVRHGWIFEAMIRLRERNEEIDNITVAEELRQQGRLEDCGGAVYITYLINETPSGIYAETYAEIVSRAADRRKWLGFAKTLADEAHAESDNIGTQFTTLLGQFARCRPRALNRGLMLNDDVNVRFWEMQSREEGDHKVFPLPWRGALDHGLPYGTGGKVMVWGGDEKTGKTAGCETLAEHWLSLGLNGFYIHTEQTGDDMILRRYSRRSGVPFLRLETPWKMSDDERSLAAKAESVIAEWGGRMEFYRDMPLTPKKAMDAMRRAVDVFDVDFIVLDQFTSLNWESATTRNEANQRYEFVSQVVDFAERTGVLVLIATQMKNAPEGRRAFGTKALGDLAALFFDVQKKALKDPLKFRADGAVHTLRPGSFDPRVDLYPVRARFTSSATIPLFYDGRRLLWRDRDEVEILSEGVS